MPPDPAAPANVCSCSRFNDYSPFNCVVHGTYTAAPVYPAMKCPDCGVWWRTASHACIGVAPVTGSDPDAFTDAWCQRRAASYADDARTIVGMVRDYEDVHPDDAPCLRSLLGAIDKIAWARP